MLQETKKALKTSAELEAAIKQEMQDIGKWSADIAVAVLPDGASWKVVIPQDVRVDRDRFEMILLITDRLRSQFSLKR
jgi:hypothetical protein